MRIEISFKVFLPVSASVSFNQTVSPGSLSRDSFEPFLKEETELKIYIFLIVESVSPPISLTHTHTILFGFFELPPGRNSNLTEFPSFFSCQVHLAVEPEGPQSGEI